MSRLADLIQITHSNIGGATRVLYGIQSLAWGVRYLEAVELLRS